VKPPENVSFFAQPLDRFRALLGEARYREIEAAAGVARVQFAGRAIWHINSTARGGGVAELLSSMLPYVRGAGIDTRWIAIHDGAAFFRMTKRLHNHLHGDPGDGGQLGDAERGTYETTLAGNTAFLRQALQDGDIAYLHDPQTAGMAPSLKELGLKIIWRCHIGVDEPDDLVRASWDFLRPYVEAADAFVFSRREYVWDGLDPSKVWLVPPAIDPFSAKNQELSGEVVDSILATIGLLAERETVVAPCFTRADGTPGRVDRQGRVLQTEPLPSTARLVAQVSRWDGLKDPQGLLACFERYFDDPNTHLALVAPSTEAVSDDPEGSAVYEAVSRIWREMPSEKRRLIHLVSLPMEDLEENGAMVNALQRRADVLVQKSLAEGFGLTVTEAMWKSKPVVGSCVGGIKDQIVDGQSGVLNDDPHDLESFATGIRSLLYDPRRAGEIGEAAHRRVADRYLGVNRLTEYVDLLASLLGTDVGSS
jgi:trehalose synthase